MPPLKIEKKKNSFLACTLVIVSVILDGTGLLVSYIVGIYQGTIETYPYVPYVSDLGDRSPNSSWFTLFLSASLPFIFFVIEGRFSQIKRKDTHQGLGRLNSIAYYIGVVSVIGKLVVVSFQLNSSKRIHYAGASIYFIASLLYIILQTILTYKTRSAYQDCQKNHNNNTRILTLIRSIICFGMGSSMLVFLPFATIPSLSVYNRYGINVAQGAEWALVFIHTTFTLTFIYDFWGVAIHRKILVSEAISEGVDETDCLAPLVSKSRYGSLM